MSKKSQKELAEEINSREEPTESLTKEKRRTTEQILPRTEKQKEAFEKAREARRQYLEEKRKKKEILTEIKTELKGIAPSKGLIDSDEFESDRYEESIEDEIPNKKLLSRKKEIFINESTIKKDKRKPFTKKLPYKDEDINSDTEIEEEVIIVKKPKKKKKVIKKVIIESSSEEEEEEEFKPVRQSRETKSQQNRNTKRMEVVEQPKQIQRFYFAD